MMMSIRSDVLFLAYAGNNHLAWYIIRMEFLYFAQYDGSFHCFRHKSKKLEVVNVFCGKTFCTIVCEQQDCFSQRHRNGGNGRLHLGTFLFPWLLAVQF